jgi:hypothetical protein
MWRGAKTLRGFGGGTCLPVTDRNVIKSRSFAPVAQWIECRPPEPKSAVRVCAGVPDQIHPELDTSVEEQLISMLRFEH